MIPAASRLASFVFLLTCVCRSDAGQPIIGDSEQIYRLAPMQKQARGIAWDTSDPQSPRLLALDQAGTVFSYSLGPDSQLTLSHTLDLRAAVKPAQLSDPRGLTWVVEQGQCVLYFLDWRPEGARLWRYDMEHAAATDIDLSLVMFRIGDREAYGVAADENGLLVSYDASRHGDPNRRVQRGILRIRWNGVLTEQTAVVEHLPDAGTAPSRGVAVMRLDGAEYLWGTIGNDHVYCADLRTGRGLFFFDRPASQRDDTSCWGMCFGQDALWVTENGLDFACVHRVNVTGNLDAALTGPKVPRHLMMSIVTEPDAAHEDPGAVYHNYSRPFSAEVMPNQGICLETEQIRDLSSVSEAAIRQITLDPAGDAASRQILQSVEYRAAVAKTCSSSYEIDLWTNPYKKFVYPHRANRDAAALAGTDYLADDPTLYRLSDRAVYDAFIQRVRSHIRQKYAAEADMENPYWAARNIVEYIQDHYYYPSCDDRKPATVDYERGHYDANPANLKIELSAKPYDQSQIIACSGTSVMVAGAMRFLGVPARWLGTGTEQAASAWDENGNGLLDGDESAPCTNGHRYTQVWLGSHYGWICFDATPSKPALNDYADPPPLQSQWRYMTRCAAGHREPRRIVFNIGSSLIEPLYRDFEYDAQMAIDNNCGGDQRYNLQGRFEKCMLWKLPQHSIRVRNLCFLTHVNVERNPQESVVTWKLLGKWDRIPDATVSAFLQGRDDGGPWHDVKRLFTAIRADAGSAAVNLPESHASQLRVILRREGDPETGGVSEPFSAE